MTSKTKCWVIIARDYGDEDDLPRVVEVHASKTRANERAHYHSDNDPFVSYFVQEHAYIGY